MTLNLPTPAVALAIVAHPDDAEFQCGATLAKWAADGCVVHHLVLTDGSKGTWDPDADTAALVETRRREQRAAAKALGATGEVVMLGEVDGELELGTARPRARWRTGSGRSGPTWCWATTRGSGTGCTPTTATPAGSPSTGSWPPAIRSSTRSTTWSHHRPDALLLFEADEPDHVEDVTGFVDAKIAALLAHRSQFVTTMYIDDADTGEQLQQFRDRVFERMRRSGEPEGVAFAEAFRCLDRL